MKKLLPPLLVALALVACAPAGAAAKRGRVLATGDSMIQIVDGFLAHGLEPRGFGVRSDAHIGTGLSKPALFDWLRHASQVARSYRPTASVVFIGANEGFAMPWKGRRRLCCSRAWRQAYAVRAQAMMRSLERGGASTVYWLTLPAARPGHWNHIYRSVNLALRSASKREGPGVRLLDMGKVFTPGGRFRETIVRGGHRIAVRQADGIHLNVAGARIAAQVVVRHMRHDHLFG